MTMLEYTFYKTGEELLRSIQAYFELSWFRSPVKKVQLIKKVIGLKRDWKVLKKKLETSSKDRLNPG